MPPRRAFRQKTLAQVLEGGVDTPAALLNGLLLKAGKDPRGLVDKWVSRADGEVAKVLEAGESRLWEEEDVDHATVEVEGMEVGE